MIHAILEVVSLVFIVGLTILLPIGIYRAAPPSQHDREICDDCYRTIQREDEDPTR